jgi:hypothetical protein
LMFSAHGSAPKGSADSLRLEGLPVPSSPPDESEENNVGHVPGYPDTPLRSAKPEDSGERHTIGRGRWSTCSPGIEWL